MDLKQEYDLNREVKLLRAQGECLGIRSRRRTR